MKQKKLTLGGIVLFVAFFVSCNESKAPADDIQTELDSIKAVNMAQARQIKDFTGWMSVLSEGLDSIAKQENILLGTDAEGNRLSKTQQKENLESFAALLERQRQRIAALEDSLNNKGENVSELKKVIDLA